MLIPREGSLLLAASGSLRIVREPMALNLAWNLIFGIYHETIGRVVHLWTRSTDTGSSTGVAFAAVSNNRGPASVVLSGCGRPTKQNVAVSPSHDI